MLESNLNQIRATISQACTLAKRDQETVKLVAVTKTVSIERMLPLISAGINEFGENRVESLREKQRLLQDHEIVWHFIGRLQRRKVKEVINQIDYFHALDKESLAMEIQKRGTRTIKCFVQVNVSEEASKQGCLLEDTIKFIVNLERFDRIKVVGLMTMAPYDASDEEIVRYFETLAKKKEEIVKLNLSHAPCTELSMGMSQDYPLAIKSGATLIRIGTAFFKE